MSSYYFDTSAALKHYHSERGTEEIRRLVHDSASHCILSRLTLTEMQRAFARRARQRELNGDELKRLRGILYKDLQQHRFCLIRVQEFHHHSAVRLFLKYWKQNPFPEPTILPFCFLSFDSITVLVEQGIIPERQNCSMSIGKPSRSIFFSTK